MRSWAFGPERIEKLLSRENLTIFELIWFVALIAFNVKDARAYLKRNVRLVW